MRMNFDDFWNRAVIFLQEKIKDGGGELKMCNWSKDDKIRRETIPMIKASEKEIICLTEKGENYKATRNDLQYTYGVYDDYKKGDVLRGQIREEIHTSTYTICTIHYLEKNRSKLNQN
ncbi:MAG: hypothetical protein V3V99_15195 [candidate division Zixibacteria bacterium]